MQVSATSFNLASAERISVGGLAYYEWSSAGCRNNQNSKLDASRTLPRIRADILAFWAMWIPSTLCYTFPKLSHPEEPSSSIPKSDVPRAIYALTCVQESKLQ